ncbi:uncharacterized protein BKCO1_3200060 [Diplodia corticola]|uniref:Large ribosomal subunit protein mL67 n=1 Tax=Diplodia corticola TaxID=236234 RepID=A0A1J9QXZ0_9PEZI|nr:uncharacterized protein BKCO1_3200060 [Diplodia corticola]OJD33256.1 hypothetical protein BKCO1_3200060 [Diplodia corticola]
MVLTRATRAAQIATKRPPPAQKTAEHGRHIFIYNHIRTNQTVYSLHRSLNNADALSQLAYAGKKTIPAKLRKDVWRPLAVVTFTKTVHCLTTYRQLREFRKLHELHWDNNKQYPKLAPERQKEIEQGRTAPTKKERARIIMDQKANSIADLAALLQKYDEEARRRVEQIEAMKRSFLKPMAAAVSERTIHREMVDKAIAEKQSALDEPGLDDSTKARMLEELRDLEREKTPLVEAEAADNAKTSAFELAIEAEVGGLVEIEKQIREAKSSLATKKGRPYSKQRVKELQKEYGKMCKAVQSVWNPEAETDKVFIGKRSTGVDGKPRWLAEGVSIKWADVVDASYAKQWPPKVKHTALEPTRHSMPVSV